MTPNMEYPNLDLIRQGVEYRFKIRCRNLEMTVRPLSIQEEDQIVQEVIESMDKLPPVLQTSLKQSALLAIKKLEMAQTSDTGKNDFKVAQIELQKMTAGELDYLFKQYNAGCDKVNPTMETLERSMVEKMVDDLKKNSKDMESQLIESSFFQLVAICRHLLTTGGSPEAS